ncbi:MAG: S-layer homology domain-containing protein [Clostridia bacterium]|nr:S-layer homology domain-containing protein [Clostridia bacterium]
MKKIFSLLLAFCISLSLLVYVEAEEIVAVSTESASELLFDMGLLKGDENGNLNGDSEITRAEFLMMLSRIMPEYAGVKEIAFTDVSADHWAADCIGFFTSKGIIDGYGEDIFAPDEKVKLEQAVKIALVSLGLSNESLEYPEGFLIAGAKYGLLGGVNTVPSAELKRDEASTLIFNMLCAQKSDGNRLINSLDKKIYFISKDGADDNDGSIEKPWATLAKAAESANGNAIVFIKGGIYEENPVIFKGKGESYGKPLIIRSNLGETVELIYKEDAQTSILIPEGSDNIALKNLIITKNSENEESVASLVKCDAKGFVLSDNIINVNAVGVELTKAERASIVNNIFLNGTTAVSLESFKDAKIFNNKFDAQSISAVSASASKDLRVYNNKININYQIKDAAIILDNKTDSCALWNNIIYGTDADVVATGVLCRNTQNSHFYNNIVAGVKGAIHFREKNEDIVLRNNIFSDCGDMAYIIEDKKAVLDSDYNCFNETYPVVIEKNSIFENPFFASHGEDWHLLPFSEALESGETINSEFIGADGASYTLDLADYDGKKREERWNMGIYAKPFEQELSDEETDALLNPEEKPFMTFDFSAGMNKFATYLGEWKVVDGVLSQTMGVSHRASACYEFGEKWENYEVTMDIRSTSENSGNATGLIFRSDVDMMNFYCFRFLANDQLEFFKLVNDGFKSIKKWNYEYAPETVYNFRVKADGNHFTFWVNEELIGEATDDSFKAGTVGAYSYKETNDYDNIKIYQIK